MFTGRTDTEAEAPILWPPDAKSQHMEDLNKSKTRKSYHKSHSFNQLGQLTDGERQRET